MATLDVLTVEEARGALKGLKGVADSDRLAGLVTTVSKMLDEACGPIVARPVVDRFVDQRTGPLFLTGKTLGPVVVTEAYAGEAPVTVPAADYVVDDGITASVTRWAGYWAPRVTVAYDAGRFATTDAVQEPFTTAAGLLLQAYWRRSDGGGSETYGAVFEERDAEARVQKMLAGELLPPAIA